jgi:hypothetical protein
MSLSLVMDTVCSSRFEIIETTDVDMYCSN